MGKYGAENFVKLNGKIKYVPDIFIEMQRLWNLLEAEQEFKDSLLEHLQNLTAENEKLKTQLTGNENNFTSNLVFTKFALPILEFDKVRLWQIEHRAKNHDYDLAGANEGVWDYIFTPKGVKIMASCRCKDCGEEFIFRELD